MGITKSKIFVCPACNRAYDVYRDDHHKLQKKYLPPGFPTRKVEREICDECKKNGARHKEH